MGTKVPVLFLLVVWPMFAESSCQRELFLLKVRRRSHNVRDALEIMTDLSCAVVLCAIFRGLRGKKRKHQRTIENYSVETKVFKLAFILMEFCEGLYVPSSAKLQSDARELARLSAFRFVLPWVFCRGQTLTIHYFRAVFRNFHFVWKCVKASVFDLMPADW